MLRILQSFSRSTRSLRTLVFSSCLATCLQRGCQINVPEDTEKNGERSLEKTPG